MSMYQHQPPGDMAMEVKHQQTLQWQQNQYLTDSGIHSGATTKGPGSISGRSSHHSQLSGMSGASCLSHEELAPQTPLDQSVVDWPAASGWTPETRGQRVRGVMFPEMQEQPNVGVDSAVGRLANQGQAMKGAVQGLSEYQGDAELARHAFPDLLALLGDEDHVVVAQAAIMVHQMCKKEASRNVLCQMPEVIKILFHIMNSNPSPEAVRNCAGAVNHIAHTKPGCLAIFQCGGIQVLVKMLGSPIDAIRNYALTSVHTVLLHQEGAKNAVRLAGGVESLCARLDSRSEKFLAILVDCLQILSFAHQESKLLVLRNGGPAHLVRIMHSFSYEKLLWSVSRLMKVLSICQANKQAIVEAGGMHALAKLLTHPSVRLLQNCLWTLRNLSDAATKLTGLDHLLQMLIQILGSNPESALVTCVVGILSNLTCNNQHNKIVLSQHGGVEALVSVVGQTTSADVVEPALCALRHLTSRHPEAEHAASLVRLHYGMPIILKLIQPPSRLSVVKAAMGLVRNLTSLEENRINLRENGAVPLLTNIMTSCYQEVASNRRDPTDGVRPEDLMEMSVGILSSLAKDAESREMLRQLNVTPILVQMLYMTSETLLRHVSSIISLLSQDEGGPALLERDGAVAPLTDLVNSRNESVASHAAAILYKIGQTKPSDFQRRLSVELTASLLDTLPAPPSSQPFSPMDHMPDFGPPTATPPLETTRQKAFPTACNTPRLAVGLTRTCDAVC